MTIYTTICQDSQSRTIAYRLTLGYHALATACSSIDQSRIIIIIKLIRMRNIYAYRATCTIGWRTSPSSFLFCLAPPGHGPQVDAHDCTLKIHVYAQHVHWGPALPGLGLHWATSRYRLDLFIRGLFEPRVFYFSHNLRYERMSRYMWYPTARSIIMVITLKHEPHLPRSIFWFYL